MKSNDLDARNQGANENKLKNKLTFIGNGIEFDNCHSWIPYIF